MCCNTLNFTSPRLSEEFTKGVFMRFSFLMMALFLIGAACSSPQETYDDQRMEAKRDYKEDIKQAEEEYEEDEGDLNKDRAQKMIDQSEGVEVDVEENKIDLE